MPREPFDITVNGAIIRTNLTTGDTRGETRPSRRASESAIGVSRRKPEGKFIDPTAYQLNRKTQIYRNGYRERRAKHVGGTDFSWIGPIGADTTAGGRTDDNMMSDALPESWLNVPLAMRDKALIKARMQMKQQDVNLGVAFAERNRTAQLVADSATSIGKSLRNLRRGRWRQAWRDLGSSGPKPRGATIPQKWLEMQYGWKPLLSDCYGSVDALARRNDQDWRVTGKGSVKEEQKFRFVGQTEETSAILCSGKAWRGCFVRIDAIPANDLLRALSSLGVTNPALIAWELVPFSFMVDWFLPIGSFLDSLDAMLGYENARFSSTTFSKGNWKVEGGSVTTSANIKISEGSQPGLKEIVKLNRIVANSVPLPTMPRLRDGRSLTRMANALSILALSFGR